MGLTVVHTPKVVMRIKCVSIYEALRTMPGTYQALSAFVKHTEAQMNLSSI